MALLIYILFFATVYHFIYESILLPSWRFELNSKLYALRDEVRKLKFTHGSQFKDETFLHLQHSINTSISLLPHLTPSLIAAANKEMASNPDLQSQVKKSTALLASCQVKEVKNVMDAVAQYTLTALILNMGGWFFYLFPILVIAIPIMFFVGTFKKLKLLIQHVPLVLDYQGSKQGFSSECFSV